MRKPDFTDSHRWPNGPYVRSDRTNIAETFRRERERLKAMSNVVSLAERKAGEPNQAAVLGRHPKGAA
jgi:hypothetical protein